MSASWSVILCCVAFCRVVLHFVMLCHTVIRCVYTVVSLRAGPLSSGISTGDSYVPDRLSGKVKLHKTKIPDDGK